MSGREQLSLFLAVNLTMKQSEYLSHHNRKQLKSIRIQNNDINIIILLCDCNR